MTKIRRSTFALCFALLALGLSNCRSGNLRIGCITPLTGDGASYGVATKRGLDLATEKINSTGGIDGKQIEIIYEDDQMNPTTATSAINKLVSVDKVPVIIGAFGSSVTLAIAPIAEKNRVVLFSASSTADPIKDSGDYIFRNVPPNRGQGRTAAKFALGQLKARTAVVLHINNDYGISLTEAFKSAFESDGGKILATDTYNPSSTDFRVQLTKIRGLKPDVVFYPGHYQESGLILKQAKELGLSNTFIGGDGSYAPDLIQIAGGAAEGSYYTLMATGSSNNKALQDFGAAFRTKYGEEAGVYSAYAYDALMTIAEGIRRGGYSADGLKEALYGIKGLNGVTGVTSFDANGEVDKPYGIYEVKGGTFVPTF